MNNDPHKPRTRAQRAGDQPQTAGGAMHGKSSDAASRTPRNASTTGRAEEKGEAKPAERADRTGADSRQRGWYWHWNGIVTQYAPLIGLKGVGLLNSYTVWTDRREHSPYRGYAFPSQQSEASFYGEDRAELITINKILVALDLIEIRKEMVTKPDAQGRRWKVPHNFYRVKDRGDGLTLTTADVLRVVELATRDPAVYRYIRKIFWARFEPIDRDNVWHTILNEIADDPSWLRLAERAQKQERRASERTKAGHRSRKRSDPKAVSESKDQSPPNAIQASNDAHPDSNAALLTSGQYRTNTVDNDEHGGASADQNKTTDDTINNGSATDVDASNNGFSVDVAASNQGSSKEGANSDEPANNGRASSVASSNTMYYQDQSTTTTTTTRARGKPGGASKEAETLVLADLDQPSASAVADSSPPGLVEDSATGPISDGASLPTPRRRSAGPPTGQANGPVGDPSALVISLFEAANDRPATKLERILLSELERDANAAAQPNGSDGARWVAAAIREAVASGSSFVAPKRIAEIVRRWAAEEDGPSSQRERICHGQLAREQDATPPIATREREIMRYIKRALEGNAYRRWFGAVRLVEATSSVLTLQAPDPAVEQKIAADYLPIIERAADDVYRRPMRILLTSAQAEDEPHVADNAPVATPQTRTSIVELRHDDLPAAQQLWQLAIEDLQSEIHHTTLERIRNVVPLGVDLDGQLLLGATGRLAERGLQSSSGLISQSLARILGQHHPIKVIPRDAWRVIRSDE